MIKRTKGRILSMIILIQVHLTMNLIKMNLMINLLLFNNNINDNNNNNNNNNNQNNLCYIAKKV